MSSHEASRTPVPLRRPADRPASGPAGRAREPLWRDLVGDALRRERLAQGRTLKEVAETARISMPYLSELERGRKEASSEVLAAAARALGLSLGDLLVRVHSDLTAATGTAAGSVAHRGVAHRGVPRHAVPHRGGMCLAA
ncbi:helix-turn-helix domain-containing protein [Streptomyces fragilis]|uniref:Helix-turn-helix transcriptional regulator n=1 Tax=Streptomyces fragilis TaxID=67301 RepID=A0ABV2YRK7_9ACTN|nr:helix-turn-helix transcriptional regulator [Streptomyces fragilis]